MQLFYQLFITLLLLTQLAACGKPDQPTMNLYRAVHAEDIDQVERNLYWGADVNGIGPDGNSPLHVAAERGNRVIAQILLEKNADVDLPNRDGHTALYLAVMSGRIQIALLLTKYQARFAPDQLLLDVARNGINDRDVLRFLLKQGAQINIQDDEGNTPLHIAVNLGHRVLVRQLITRGADLNLKNKAGNNPLELAIASRNEEIIQLLRQHGAILP